MATRGDLGELLTAKGLIDLPAVEVGVAEGRYSKEIMDWGVPLLYLVDVWMNVPGGLAELSGWDDDQHCRNLEEVKERLANYEDQYKILRGWSFHMCDLIEDNSVGFVFIDASHDYQNVLRDLRCYWPKLVDGGVMAGHDYKIEGVAQAVQEFADEMNLVIHELPVNEDDVSYWLEAR